MSLLMRALAVAAFLLLAGCAGLPPSAPPSGPATEPPGPVADPSHNTAVLALLDQAQAQAASGQAPAAGATLERALRIEPRNPALWSELARLRLSQGQYQQAQNLAAKSNALAGGDRRLRVQNWRIIGQARAKLGDARGAQAAFERAERESN